MKVTKTFFTIQFFRLPGCNCFNVTKINYLQTSFWESMMPHHPQKLVLNLKSIRKCDLTMTIWMRRPLKSGNRNILTMATFRASTTMRCQWIFVILIFMEKFKATHMENVAVDDVECPASSENSACPCYKFDDGEFEWHFNFN